MHYLRNILNLCAWNVFTIFFLFSTQKVLLAQAEADGIRAQGIARAAALQAVGKAEAERMRLRAEAYNKYGDAALLSLVLDALPRVAAEIAAPLGRTKEIVLMGGSGEGDNMNHVTNLGKDLVNMIGTLPPAVRALTNVDLTKVSIKFITVYLFI